MKKEPQMWIAADFECGNKPVNEPHWKTLLSNKPIGVCYKTLKKNNFCKFKFGKTWI